MMKHQILSPFMKMPKAVSRKGYLVTANSNLVIITAGAHQEGGETGVEVDIDSSHLWCLTVGAGSGFQQREVAAMTIYQCRKQKMTHLPFVSS